MRPSATRMWLVRLTPPSASNNNQQTSGGEVYLHMFARRVPGILLSALLLTAAGIAQTTTPPTSLNVSSFTVEATVPLDSIDAVNTPTITPDVLASLRAGALEIREQITYSQANKSAEIK